MKVKALKKQKDVKKEKKKPSKKLVKAVAGVLVLAVAGSGIGYYMLHTKTSENDSQKEEAMQQLEDSQGITEEGTTQVGTIAQLPDFDVNTVNMQVEEVYVEAGSAVNEGDALFKITDESITAITEYYEDAIADAKDALETAQLEYENGKLEAEYVKQESLLNAQEAPTELETALTELEESIQEKKETYEQAETDITTYTNNLENNSYYTNAGIDEKTTAVSDAEEALKKAEEEYKTADETYQKAETSLKENIESLSSLSETEAWDEETINKVKSLAKEIAEGYKDTSEKEAKCNEKKTTYDNAGQEVQKTQMTLEEAKLSYEKNTEEATQKLSELEASIDELKNTYETAVLEAEGKKVDLQNEYDTAVLEGNYADETYQTTVAALEDAVETAKKNLEDLQEEQTAVLNLENGVVCASQAGTIAAVTYEAEDILKTQTAVVYYYDTSVITISVEVPQEDIAKIAVGDTAEVMISNNRRGNMQGTVTTIASTATTGGSVSNVTYAVEVSVDNTEGTLSAGQSATVIFSEAAETTEAME